MPLKAKARVTDKLLEKVDKVAADRCRVSGSWVSGSGFRILACFG